MTNPVFWEKIRKSIIDLSSAEFANSVLSFKSTLSVLAHPSNWPSPDRLNVFILNDSYFSNNTDMS